MSSSKNLRRSSRIKASSFVRKTYTEDSDEETYERSSLFSKKDVSGRKLYGFHTPTKRDSMILKANECRSSSTNFHECVTPRSLKTLPVLKVVLENIKISPEEKESFLKGASKKVTAVGRKQYLPNVHSSGDESVSEDSEYIPNDTEGSSESDEESLSSTDSESSDAGERENEARKRIKRDTVQKAPPKCEVPSTPARPTRRCKAVACKDYHIKTDEYFASQSEKVVTSDRTLGRLRSGRLTKETLEELLSNENHISGVHKRRICSLTENCKSFFRTWHFIMEEGYNLLLYGLGSKRNLINDFHHEVVANHPTLVINGFFPSLTVKDILDSLIVDLLDLDCPTNPNDCLELIERVLGENADDRLYLIIHNIDGLMLRSDKAQDVLASLAAIPNIHIIASVDHINAPLLWDHTKRAKFNFYWWDATTLLPYQAETAYESSLLVQRSGALASSSLQNVFLSLTSNARAIYLILVKYQLNHSSGNFTGMPFKDLYRAAREQFLVSSDLALRAQLTEFVDHKLVRTKRTFDGAEHVTIPLDKSLLKQFMEQHGS
ncbi:origin recognition complex subunit 2 isoform X2 [Ooceraea biroi]|uniref:origin recognition complex subunit 2 isoform X2 n=1 Tax=Ooceraea biroi TaxID=2015173 RepID=UPI0005BA1107|nr:origin recognition complex subunit 2 isoform X2 [Ooceraea biroi]